MQVVRVPITWFKMGTSAFFPLSAPTASVSYLPTWELAGTYIHTLLVPWSLATVVPPSFSLITHPPGLSCETITTTMERTSVASDCATAGAAGTRTTFPQSSSVRHSARVSESFATTTVCFCKVHCNTIVLCKSIQLLEVT